MVGRIWEFAVELERVPEFEEFAARIALPMVRGKMGCSAVYVLRDADAPGRYCWVTLWVSRKAFVVASQSSDWNDLGARISAFGASLDFDRARAFDAVASFRAGETG